MTSTKLQQDNIVDVDTIPFMATQATHCTLKEKKVVNANTLGDVLAADTETFFENQTTIGANNESAGCETSTERFGKIYNKYGYSKLIRVHIENACIMDIGLFTNELRTKFIHTIGNNTVDKVTVSHYTKANAIVDSIDVIVSFCVPIGYQYLSAFKFPKNWVFFEFNTNNRTGKRSFYLSTMPRKEHKQHRRMNYRFAPNQQLENTNVT